MRRTAAGPRGRRHLPQDARSASSSVCRGSGFPTPTSAAPGRRAPAAPSAATAWSAAGSAPRTRWCKNYLALAERLGVDDRAAAHRRLDVRRAGRGERGIPGHHRAHRGVAAQGPPHGHRPQVVFAAGAWGTQRLLHAMQDSGALPAPVRPARPPAPAPTPRRSAAPRSSTCPRGRRPHRGAWRSPRRSTPTTTPTSRTCRYGKGSNAMGAARHDPGRRRRAGPAPRPVPRRRGAPPRRVRPLALAVPLERAHRHRPGHADPRQLADGLGPRAGSSAAGCSPHGRATASPTPPGSRRATARWSPSRGGSREATGLRALPGQLVGEVVDVPMTAHFLGGAVIGADRAGGVIDPYHRVWGYPGLHVVDGSAVSANLGVNPSLTITAQAERAMSLWPNHDEADPRPAQGEDVRHAGAHPREEPGRHPVHAPEQPGGAAPGMTPAPGPGRAGRRCLRLASCRSTRRPVLRRWRPVRPRPYRSAAGRRGSGPRSCAGGRAR